MKLPGSPDLVFAGKRVVVFVDGCFWHGCPKCAGVPQQSGEFWSKKISDNIARDARVDRELTAAGWRVHRVREHDTKTADGLEAVVEQIAALLRA